MLQINNYFLNFTLTLNSETYPVNARMLETT